MLHIEVAALSCGVKDVWKLLEAPRVGRFCAVNDKYRGMNLKDKVVVVSGLAVDVSVWGDREQNKQSTVEAALAWLKEYLISLK